MEQRSEKGHLRRPFDLQASAVKMERVGRLLLRGTPRNSLGQRLKIGAAVAFIWF
jgi:hypothetical protein